MNNAQIIADIAATIYGQEYVTSMTQNGQEIPLHTAKGWSDRGYRVKPGELKHGIETKLWKKRKIEDTESGAKEQVFYKSKAYLFTMSQVEREVENV